MGFALTLAGHGQHGRECQDNLSGSGELGKGSLMCKTVTQLVMEVLAAKMFFPFRWEVAVLSHPGLSVVRA